jgi:hypothetical protein
MLLDRSGDWLKKKKKIGLSGNSRVIESIIPIKAMLFFFLLKLTQSNYFSI